jgi:hypothetical protein
VATTPTPAPSSAQHSLVSTLNAHTPCRSHQTLGTLPPPHPHSPHSPRAQHCPAPLPTHVHAGSTYNPCSASVVQSLLALPDVQCCSQLGAGPGGNTVSLQYHFADTQFNVQFDLLFSAAVTICSATPAVQLTLNVAKPLPLLQQFNIAVSQTYSDSFVIYENAVTTVTARLTLASQGCAGYVTLSSATLALCVGASFFSKDGVLGTPGPSAWGPRAGAPPTPHWHACRPP